MHSIAKSVISLYSRHHNRQSGHLACNFLSLRVSQQIRTWPGLLKPKRAYRIRCQSEHRMNMSQLSREQLHSLPGVAKARDPATEGFEFQQTMLRVMDAERSLKFYTEVLGMTLLSRFDFADMKFSLYFLGYADPDEIPDDPVERARWMFSRPGCLELTHNWLTEEEKKELEEKGGYHSGNSDPRGFGHIGISVPSVDKACDRFEKMGVEFVKRPQDGKMKFVAFIKDPDGYWIEILSPDSAKPIVNWPSA